MSERSTVIVTPRDRFSTIEKCLRNVLKFTKTPVDVWLVAGGVPEALERRLRSQFDGRVQFIFREKFMNTAELRNMGLREAKTGTAACLDSDVFVRPGWFEPLARCQKETGAGLVVPIVLDRQSLIHTAGNDFYVTTHKGRRYGMAELRYANLPYVDGANIPRRETDFGEVHCHFVDVKKALELGIYDENLREGSDFDSGMTLKKAGLKLMIEPDSVVYLHYPEVLNNLVDFGIYRWKWNIEACLESFHYFERKWGIDMLSKSNMRNHLVMLNHRVGFCTQLFPTPFSIAVDGRFLRAKKAAGEAFKMWQRFKTGVTGLARTRRA
jgi:GT2 family glycosyltransferase